MNTKSPCGLRSSDSRVQLPYLCVYHSVVWHEEWEKEVVKKGESCKLRENSIPTIEVLQEFILRATKHGGALTVAHNFSYKIIINLRSVPTLILFQAEFSHLSQHILKSEAFLKQAIPLWA
ncbi:uncharacterized protein LOC120891856 [Ictidomys tridecemlineatus]